MVINDKIEKALAVLPDKPGVYLMRDGTGRVLYVGKAKNLNNRVHSYFRASGRHSAKVVALTSHVDDLETILTDSEIEALILECNLIKKYRPRYNIMLKDDKTYPYLKVTLQDEFPRMFITRRVLRDGARYYGPYPDVGALRSTMRLLRALFPIRQCRSMNVDRPCLQYHIKRCPAPCAGKISKADYAELVRSICLVMDGKTQELRRILKEKMQAASEAYAFEEAARYRDQLKDLARLDESQKAVLEGGDMDVVGYASDDYNVCLQIFFVRGGKLVGRKDFMMPNGGDGEGEVVSAFLKQYYSNEDVFLPKEVLLPERPDAEETALLTQWLTERAGRKVALLTPQRGDKAKLLQLACDNARKLIEEKERKGSLQLESDEDAAEDLQRAIGAAKPLARMDCFDISHNQGSETVASMVVFRYGAPSKKDYRRYKLQSTEGKPDDFKSMQEVVYRRYKDYEDLPDLIIIDGGKGQLSSSLKVIRGLGLDTQVIGLAKREEEIFLEGQKESILLDKASPALHVIQHIRDEAHRFAITYHRKRLRRHNLVSILDQIEGIGPKRRQALWKAFPTLEGMRAASEEELAAVDGMTAPLARKLYEFFRGDVVQKTDLLGGRG
ncbi:MAG: excinuclease ABC subunit UvrC [Succiniclasticum sp.]|jgi:excinuclease ABC subunit C|nr:excinuclease ABC subunit UvrC [Succiniclasticum sp.]MCI6222982.1 excinuclease ABC subunit UvrC [Selenomonadales bacterium]